MVAVKAETVWQVGKFAIEFEWDFIWVWIVNFGGEVATNQNDKIWFKTSDVSKLTNKFYDSAYPSKVVML